MTYRNYNHILSRLAVVPLFVLLFSILSACNDKQPEQKIQKNVIPVKIYSGMQLGSLLNKINTKTDTAEIKMMQGKKWYSSVNVISLNNMEKRYSISSCNDYFKHSDEKITPARENEINAYAELVLMCKTAKDIIEAEPSKVSYLSGLELNNDLPRKLPKQFALTTSSTESNKINADVKLVSWADVNKITSVEVSGSHKAIYKQSSATQEIELIAQADINKDGIEDFIISSRDSVANGSYSALRIFCVTKLSQGEAVKVIKEYNY